MPVTVSGHIVCGDEYAEIAPELNEMCIGHVPRGEVVLIEASHVMEPTLRRLIKLLRTYQLHATLDLYEADPTVTKRTIVTKDGVSVTFEEIPMLAPTHGPARNDDIETYKGIVKKYQKMETEILRNLYEDKLPRKRRMPPDLNVLA